MATRRKFWGWGAEDQHPSAAQRGAMASALSARFGTTSLESIDPPRVEELSLRSPAPEAAAEPRGVLLAERGGSCRTHLRKIVPRRGARLSARLCASPRRGRISAQRSGSRRGARLVRVGARDRHPLRRGSSVVGGVEVPRDERYAGAVTVDLSHLDRVLEIDRASRAARIQAGVLGPALEDQLRPSRPDAPSLPTVVRVLLARRLDRDSLGRPLRDLVHAHRRLRGIAASGHAERDRGIAPAAGLGRRTQPGPDVHRIRRNPRHHHRGMDAPAGPTDVPQLRRRSSSTIFSRARAP